MIRVVIADDHNLLLDGLAQALDRVPDISVVGTAADGRELLAALETAAADVVLVDYEMPHLDGLKALRRLASPPPTIVVTMHSGDELRREAERAGAIGFLSKSTPLPDLAAAVRAAHAGERLFVDIDATLDRHREAQLDAGAAALTQRERELLALLAGGVSSTEDIADAMFISQKTVKNHLANIYEKLAVTDRAQAAVEAIRLGISARHR